MIMVGKLAVSYRSRWGFLGFQNNFKIILCRSVFNKNNKLVQQLLSSLLFLILLFFIYFYGTGWSIPLIKKLTLWFTPLLLYLIINNLTLLLHLVIITEVTTRTPPHLKTSISCIFHILIHPFNDSNTI